VKVLLVGSGGREHALAWKLKQSPLLRELHCAPGNAGIAQLATCHGVSAEDVPGLLALARRLALDLTVVGPEAPLVAGIVDEFAANGLRAFGPTKAAAALEGSKSFCRELLERHNLPSAKYAVFTEPDSALRYVREQGAPIVVKADGLAAGKGAIVCASVEQAEAAVRRILVDRAFGDAGDRLVVEECLQGPELSLIAFSDGETVSPMVPSQDHKRIGEGDTGPNTGGMGCYSPVPVVTPEVFQQAVEQVLKPTVAAMAAEGRLYKGVLYAGLMLTDTGPRVLEFNARFGDPETQVILPRLESDLLEIMLAVVDGKLDSVSPKWSERVAVCVVVASGGYPGSYEKGKPIGGLDEAEKLDDVTVFHAGTAQRDGRVVSAGGRVLGVTALGDDFPAAVRRAYEGVDRISFEGAYCRRDIARRALR
jgi:phosphoribosylamine--glycine ligase